jgi:hypothetical protein
VNLSSSLHHFGADAAQIEPELRLLFHELNNQLGIVLAHAELLEAKATDSSNRARAAQVVKSVLDAMGTAKEIRRRSEPQAAV